MEQQEMKEAAGRAAAEALVKSGMKLGLGTGSTAVHVIRRVGELLKAGTLNKIRAVPTSFQSRIECEKWGIPVFDLNAPELEGTLDLCIDGADEVDGENRLIKGGGGALLIEKVAAYNAAACAIVADETKLVDQLGLAFPLPVEVIPEARVCVSLALEAAGARVQLREALRKAGPVITEHGNLILDSFFQSPVDPGFMEAELNRIPGVVENGFFTRIRPLVYVVHRDGSLEVRA